MSVNDDLNFEPVHWRKVGGPSYCGMPGFVLGYPPKNKEQFDNINSIKMVGYYRCHTCTAKAKLEIEKLDKQG